MARENVQMHSVKSSRLVDEKVLLQLLYVEHTGSLFLQVKVNVRGRIAFFQEFDF
jgi:hypothetical protein